MPCRLKWAATRGNYRMTTIDATLRHALEVSGHDLTLTLDPALQGLPETAHGGSVLAVFDASADAPAPREVSGIYRRRVPLGTPLTLLRSRADSAEIFVLSDPAGNALVDGRVAPLAADANDAAPSRAGGGGAAPRGPVLSGLIGRDAAAPGGWGVAGVGPAGPLPPHPPRRSRPPPPDPPPRPPPGLSGRTGHVP